MHIDKKMNYNKTMYACFIGYIVQAVVNNFAPLLFLTFEKDYSVELSKITLLVTVNFLVQLAVDLLSAKFVDKIGYKASAVIAHLFSFFGLVFLAILPDLFGNAFAGLLISVVVYAIGGGLIEVIISPIMESCPTDNKEKAMSLLHSFYCWGHVGVVLLSTIFFKAFGITNWKILALLWAVIPLLNIFLFLKAPIAPLLKDGERRMSLRELFTNKLFWVLLVMMVAAGASEQSVSQWASAFAEQGLGVSKATGDLAGPMLFAVLMGISRVFYGKFGVKINLDKFMIISSLLCVMSYLAISLVASPVLSLISCGLCGLSVGIMWPGTFSKAAGALKQGSTAMFALLALGGDLGCSVGPTLVGFASSSLGNNLKGGILCAVVFPVLLLICIMTCKKIKKV